MLEKNLSNDKSLEVNVAISQKNLNCKIHFETFVIWQFFFQHGLDYWFFYDFSPNFLLEAGQILERSQWIQILQLKL